MSTKRGFIAGLGAGLLGGFSGANILMQSEEDNTGQSSSPDNSNNTTNTTNETDDRSSPFQAGTVASEIGSLVNQERQSVYGSIVPDLNHNDTLAQCASYHAESMAESGSVGHEGTDGGVRARYNRFGLGQQIPNDTIEEKINSDWENIASVDATGMEPAEIASGLFDSFNEEVMLYRPWSLYGTGVSLSGTTAYATVNYL